MLILYLHGCWSSRPPPIQPNKVYGVKINCTRDVFNIKIEMDKAFKGIVFSKDFVDECSVKGEWNTPDGTVCKKCALNFHFSLSVWHKIKKWNEHFGYS